MRLIQRKEGTVIKKAVIKEFLDWAMHIVIAVIIGLLIVKYVAQLTIVYKTSMLPTLQNGNILIMEKISPKLQKLDRGDIVTINDITIAPGEKGVLIKRIIGLENDKVEIKNGKVYVNDIEIREDYINGNTTLAGIPEYSSLIVPEGSVYVLGDNRLPDKSLDSRNIGPISMDKIGGKVIMRIFPFSGFGIIKNKN